MHIVCSDLEGIFIPEIWINVAEKTGIQDLNLTTRDVPDYNVLMRQRVQILRENGLGLAERPVVGRETVAGGGIVEKAGCQ